MSGNVQHEKKTKKILIPRITQLDANEFDLEVHRILYSQIIDITNFLKPGTLNSIKSELTLLLNLIIFKYSVLQNNSTFGQDLLGLKYDRSLTKYKVYLYAVLKYFFPYLHGKYEDNMGKLENPNVIWVMKKVEIIVKLTSFLNSLIFLKEGKYPTITDRLLKLKYVPTEKYNRSVGYSFMMRQLLWLGFMELLTHVVPLINYKAMKRKLQLYISSGGKADKKIKSYVRPNIYSKCVVCNESPVLPCTISVYCPHLACYYCLMSTKQADDKFLCPECEEVNMVSNKPLFL